MRNIIISGGGFVNKGAQAMTYITILELHKRFPNHHIYVLTAESIDCADFGTMADCVSLLSWHPMKFAAAQDSIVLKLMCSTVNRNEYKETVSIYRNCELMVDISGYALGSDWSEKICSDFLDNIEYAKAFDIPVVLLPQSFGPFDYEKDSSIDKRSAALLPYVKYICAREQDGYDSLKEKYHLTNVLLKPDIVLSSSLDLNQLITGSQITIPEIKHGSVAVIPNENIVRLLGEEQTLIMYKFIIDHLLEKRRTVYIISHSNNDVEFCQSIKGIFSDKKSVNCLSQDYSCVVFNEMVKRFDFCIASRFHSIVHSYKNGIPCIAIGWAVKYRDLLYRFSQGQYLFNIDKPIEQEKLLASIDQMIDNRYNESSIITEMLSDIQKDSVFDLLNEV